MLIRCTGLIARIFFTLCIFIILVFAEGAHHNNNNAAYSAQTLVIIYGAYRTFDLTCPTIMENIVKSYYPNVHIILSVDEEHHFEIPQVAGICLQPYLKKITIIDGKVDLKGAPRQSIEFFLIKRVLDFVEQSSLTYHYAIKVRFDNVVKSPILPMPYIYHPQLDVAEKHSRNRKSKISPFLMFQEILTQEYSKRKLRPPSYAQRAYDWIITSGNPVFIANLFNVELVSHYTFISHQTWNQPIRDFVLNHTATTQTMVDSVLLVKKTMQRFHPSYLIGSTWIQYGSFELIKKSTIEVLNNFGKFKPHEFPVQKVPPHVSNVTEALCKFVNATEAIVRETHRRHNLHLIDLINQADYDKSFNNSDWRSFPESLKDPTLHYWLVRTCRRTRNYRGCQVNHLERHVVVPLPLLPSKGG